MNLDVYRAFTIEKPQFRNNRDALIYDIAEATTEKDKKLLRKRLAIAANTLGWSEMDLHALMKKRYDPSIRNYTAFVKWSCKIQYNVQNSK